LRVAGIVARCNPEHPGPPKFIPTPANGPEPHVHAHRAPSGVTADERTLVCIFLRRYVIWCAKARHFDRLRNALDLLIELAGGAISQIGTPHGHVADTREIRR
jgi:hypothetical protein